MNIENPFFVANTGFQCMNNSLKKLVITKVAKSNKFMKTLSQIDDITLNIFLMLKLLNSGQLLYLGLLNSIKKLYQ